MSAAADSYAPPFSNEKSLAPMSSDNTNVNDETSLPPAYKDSVAQGSEVFHNDEKSFQPSYPYFKDYKSY